MCGISIVLAISFGINSDHGNNAASAFAVVSENRNDPLLTIKDSKYDYNSIAASKNSSAIDGTQISFMIHKFCREYALPSIVISTPSANAITLDNGIKLACL